MTTTLGNGDGRHMGPTSRQVGNLRQACRDGDLSHSRRQCPSPLRGPIVRSMTDLPGGLDGGLDEPAELQPAEGSLRLVGDGDEYDVAAWEAAAAAVLRKARRLREDAPDSD